jgi:hypothetical protein
MRLMVGGYPLTGFLLVCMLEGGGLGLIAFSLTHNILLPPHTFWVRRSYYKTRYSPYFKWTNRYFKVLVIEFKRKLIGI